MHSSGLIYPIRAVKNNKPYTKNYKKNYNEKNEDRRIWKKEKRRTIDFSDNLHFLNNLTTPQKCDIIQTLALYSIDGFKYLNTTICKFMLSLYTFYLFFISDFKILDVFNI